MQMAKKTRVGEKVKNVKWWRKKTRRGCITFIKLITVGFQ